MPRHPHSFGWAGKERFDPRDVHYSASLAVLDALPPMVDLSARIKTPALDQKNIGACGPHCAAREMLYDQEQNALADVMPSRLQIYYCTRQLMGTTNQDSGVFNRDLCKAMAQFGWADERLWPYVTAKFRQKPPANVLADAATRKVTRYERVAQNLELMKAALAQGDPFIVGFLWYQSWETPQIAQSGDLTLTTPGDVVLGGHDVTIVGYDDAIQRFKFINSWGTNWGRNGFGTVPYDQWLDPQKASDFWTLHWDEAVTPPVPPVPPIPPVGSELLVTINGQSVATTGPVTVQIRQPATGSVLKIDPADLVGCPIQHREQ